MDGIRVDIASIDGAACTVIDGSGEGIAYLTRWPDASPEAWQYAVSVLAAALNDPTAAASAIRAKGRREVRAFIGKG